MNPEKRLETLVKNEIEKCQAMPAPNNALLLDFYERYAIKKRLSKNRIKKLLVTLRRAQEITKKPLNGLTEKALEGLNVYLSKEGYSLQTNNDFKKILKVWLKFSKQNDLLQSEELKAPNPYTNGHRLNPSDLPTDSEVLALMNALPPRIRAILCLLDGGGLRRGSAHFLKRKDLQFLPDGSLIVSFDSKTGRNSVKIRQDLASIVLTWYNEAPAKNQNDYLFCNADGSVISETVIYDSLKKAAKCAGIKKRIYPHVFRHRHASWALLNMPTALAKTRIWGTAHSRMDIVYSHFTKKQENEAYDQATGNTEPKEKPQDLFKERICFRCSKTWPATTENCSCGLPLDNKKMLEETYWRELKVKETEIRMTAIEWKLEAVLAELKNKK